MTITPATLPLLVAVFPFLRITKYITTMSKMTIINTPSIVLNRVPNGNRYSPDTVSGTPAILKRLNSTGSAMFANSIRNNIIGNSMKSAREIRQPLRQPVLSVAPALLRTSAVERSYSRRHASSRLSPGCGFISRMRIRSVTLFA